MSSETGIMKITDVRLSTKCEFSLCLFSAKHVTEPKQSEGEVLTAIKQ